MADDVQIRRLHGDDEAWVCADIMAATDPWITLGRRREHTYAQVTRPLVETSVAVAAGEIVGVIIVAMELPLIKGYIMALAVADGSRDRGIGSRLLAFAEERIFRESPNVFLCVSSFNADAQRFYERHGYEQVGILKDLVITGASELLMRKTKGSWQAFSNK